MIHHNHNGLKVVGINLGTFKKSPLQWLDKRVIENEKGSCSVDVSDHDKDGISQSGKTICLCAQDLVLIVCNHLEIVDLKLKKKKF